MGPRADFSCRACAKAEGRDGFDIHPDLPIGSKRCPIRGTKVNRLYNAVNVGSADARAHAKILDSSTIPAQMDAARAANNAAHNTMPTGENTLRGETFAMAGGSAAAALSVAQSTPGADLYRRGIDMSNGKPIVRSVDVLRQLPGIHKVRPA